MDRHSLGFNPARTYRIKLLRLSSVLLLGLLANLAYGAGTSTAIETFTPPTLAKPKAPTYPTSAQYRGYEGWVSVSMMVDAEGKAYDLTVMDSSGSDEFEKAALKVIPKWRFNPAELGSTKIDAAVRRSFTFELSGPGGPGASKAYGRKYKRLVDAIESGDQEKAEELLAKLEASSLNLYEQAYSQVGRYQYEREWGSLEGQYAALRQATFLDKDRGFLPDDVLTNFLAARLNLELQMSLFSSGRKTADNLLKRELEDSSRAEIENVQRQIDEFESSEGLIVVAGSIDDSNYFGHLLLRPTFSFRNVTGDIAELRLHCDKGYVGFVYKPEISYTVEPGYRDCGLTAIGTPGSTFELIELPTVQ